MKQMIKHLVYALGWLTLVLLLVKPLDAATYRIWGFLGDETDSPSQRSGLALRTDHGTGCQYLVSLYGGITPRMDSSGKQVCKP